MIELPRNTIVYLATPYTKYPAGILAAYKEAARIAGRLVGAGYIIFSPIAHTHPLAVYGEIDPLDHKLWMAFDAPFMSMSGALAVAMMDGWDRSVGVKAEIDAFSAAGKPTYFVCPRTLAISLRPEELAR